MRLGADAGAEGTDGDRATGSRQTAQAPRCPAPRPGRPARTGSAAEGRERLRARDPPCAHGRVLYFREFFSIIHGATFSVPNQPAPSWWARVSCSIPKMESCLSMRTPSKLFICSIYKCVCTYTDLWASVWLISIFCKYGRPSRSQRARQGPCRPAARPTSVFTSLINGSLSLYRKAGFSFLFSFLQK